MKIYTKTGDKGQTFLAAGGRVSKSDPRVDLYGTSDELNSTIGAGISFLKSESKLLKPMNIIQNLLFELGSELAGFRKEGVNESILYESDVVYLENQMDILSLDLEEMRSFILPGGAKSSSLFHIARTVCRRLERGMVKEMESGVQIFEMSLKFINRLSDFLFIAARYSNFEEGISDIKWSSRAKT